MTATGTIVPTITLNFEVPAREAQRYARLHTTIMEEYEILPSGLMRATRAKHRKRSKKNSEKTKETLSSSKSSNASAGPSLDDRMSTSNSENETTTGSESSSSSSCSPVIVATEPYNGKDNVQRLIETDISLQGSIHDFDDVNKSVKDVGVSYHSKQVLDFYHATESHSLIAHTEARPDTSIKIKSDMDNYIRNRSQIMDGILPRVDLESDARYWYRPKNKRQEKLDLKDANIGCIKFFDEDCKWPFRTEFLQVINASHCIPLAAKSMHYDIVTSYHYLYDIDRESHERYASYSFTDLLKHLINGTATKYIRNITEW